MANGNEVLIALCDGHGHDTAGKRSPSYYGKVMRENEFNSRVVALLDENLRRCGFRTLLVAQTDADTPLSERVRKANDAKADFYLSVHANAYDGKLNDLAGGIETYAHFSYPKTVDMARTIHRHITKGSPFKDRRVKNGDWLYVCKYTSMAAALVELGFMDNEHDLKQLVSEGYRQECADELAQAFCEIYDVAWVEKPTPDGVFYRVVTGSFNDRANADQRIAALKKAGFDSFIDVYKKEAK
jgi:N-acetylmuramoyl-L-alanine amidase